MFINRYCFRSLHSLGCLATRFESTVATPDLVDFRIGKIVNIRKHENADKLFVSQIQIEKPPIPTAGEEKPLFGKTVQVCSGLVGLVPMSELLNSCVVLVMNLKPSKMRGVKSQAMLLAAERETPDKEPGFEVEVVRPPKNGEIGQVLEFKGFERDQSVMPKRLKGKKWLEIDEFLKTNDNGEVCYKEGNCTLGIPDSRGREACKVQKLINCHVR